MKITVVGAGKYGSTTVQRIAEREKKEDVKPPSDPQMFVGTEMAAKLPKLEETLRARRSGSNI